MNEPLKPCPFCGGEAHIPKSQDSGENFGWGQCLECESEGTPTEYHTKTRDLSDKAIAQLWNTRASQWISVEDRLPEKEGHYLCYFSDGLVEAFPYGGNSVGEYWGLTPDENGYQLEIVEYWQPLPSPPEEHK